MKIEQNYLSDSLSSKVDEIFAKWSKPNSPGAALAIVKEGKIIYKKGYGYANLEYDIPIKSDTIFHVASVSKQFTDFAIALLAQEGKLSLDDDVHNYFPELNDFGKNITIRHLIHHTSGLRDQWELLMLAGWRLDDVITHQRIMKLVTRQNELNFEPGSQFLYCNTGYTLMAEIVKRITGKTLAEFCQERIFAPLEMKQTHFHDDHEMIVKNRAYSYAPKDTGFKKSVLSYATVGATSLFTTVEDLSKWINNFSMMQVGGPAVVNQMQEQFVLNDGEEIEYAFGLKINSYKGVKTICHSGSDAGFRSHLVMFPEQNMGIVVLANLGSINPEQLTRQVADILIPNELQADSSKATAVDQEIISDEQLIGDYLLGPGIIITISKEADQLFYKPLYAPKKKLIRKAANDFLLESNDRMIKFGYHPEQQIYMDLSELYGRKMEAEKTDLPRLTEGQLSEYVGVYYSDELDTQYNIVQQGSELVIEHMSMPDCLLRPSNKDVFEAVTNALGRLKITRDDKGNITGFLVERGRVRNLKFELMK